jgi:hypothetical protein
VATEGSTDPDEIRPFDMSGLKTRAFVAAQKERKEAISREDVGSGDQTNGVVVGAGGGDVGGAGGGGGGGQGRDSPNSYLDFIRIS